MTDQPFRITPLPHVVASLRNSAPHGIRDAGATRELWLINHAYAAGADMELKACCEWADATGWEGAGDSLRAALARWGRQPEPPAEGEVGELVEWLHGQDGGREKRAIHSRIAALLQQQAAPARALLAEPEANP